MGNLKCTVWRDFTRDAVAVNAKDGSVLLRVPAGEFEMGDGRYTERPKHLVQLDEYWIGAYCVTNRQYARFMKKTGHPAPDKRDSYDAPAIWKSGKCPADNLDHPVVCVDWNDAQAYAEWAGLSLPTEAQWEKAARGPLGLAYPWGSIWDAGLCCHKSPKSSCRTSEVWGYGRGASGYGTYQQSGNVSEWCADWYGEEYYGESERENPQGPDGVSFRVTRGRSFRFNARSDFLGALRDRAVPSDRGVFLGFRLVRTVFRDLDYPFGASR